jgi:hypothetical protein
MFFDSINKNIFIFHMLKEHIYVAFFVARL